MPHERLTPASTDTQNLQPETPLRDAPWSRGEDQIQRHRPPQPTAAHRGLPQPVPYPAGPAWTGPASVEMQGPYFARKAPVRGRDAWTVTRATQDHRFPSLTMATTGTHRQQRLLRRSRPPSGD